MSERSERVEITSTALLDFARHNMQVAYDSVVQAKNNLKSLGLEELSHEVVCIGVSLHDALNKVKSNSLLDRSLPSNSEV